MFCVAAFVLTILSPLRDARPRGNLESWLGGYGLVREWVVAECVQQTQLLTTFPGYLLRWRFFRYSCVRVSPRIAVTVKQCVSVKKL